MRNLKLYALMIVVTAHICSTSDSLADKNYLDFSPRLVIESGFHRSLIRELIFTTNSRKLISVSDDKSIRIWDVAPDGRQAHLDRVLRGPIGPGKIGAIYAAALCPPDYQNRHPWLAVGGCLSNEKKLKGAIRIHNFETGKIVSLLQGHQDVVNALSVSPNGHWLASGSKDATINIWNMATLFRNGSPPSPQVLRNHNAPVYDLAWSINGRRLASASYDNTVGLWDTSEINQKGVRLIKKLEGHTAGVRSVAFHPNGEVLASGGKDRSILLWDLKAGKSIAKIVTEFSVSALSFSEDKLIAGNADIRDTNKRVAVYEFPSLEKRGFFTNHDNTVVATAIDSSGRIAASGGGDSKTIFIWNPESLKVLTSIQGGGKTVFSVGFSKNGRYLRWGWKPEFLSNNIRGPIEHAFDLEKFELIFNKSGPTVRAKEAGGSISLLAERSENNNYLSLLHISQTDGTEKKKSSTITKHPNNGYQHSSYTLTPNNRYILTGGLNGNLELYTVDGLLIATLEGHEGEVKSVAVSSNGKWAVSGGFDQTLRLWPLEDNYTGEVKTIEPTLSIFPTVDGNWVAWTPAGYYSCSRNGFNLIGYVLNKGMDQLSQFVSVDQLIEIFYRPDILWAMIHGGIEELVKSERARLNAREVLTQIQPTQLRILEPSNNQFINSRQINVKVEIDSPNDNVNEVLWKVNDRIMQIDKINSDITKIPKIFEQVITLEAGSNRISVVARSSPHSVDSQPAIINLTCTTKSFEKPKLCILTIGINNYRQQFVQNLNYAVSDANDVMSNIEEIGAILYDIYPQKLINEEATFKNIENSFKSIADNLSANDIFILYLAGHGITQGDEFLFLAHDYYQTGTEIFNVISKQDLRKWLVGIKVLKSLVLIDACQSGGYFLMSALRNKSEETAVDKLGRFITRHVIVSSSHKQVSIEGYHNHGVFTHVLIEAFHQSGISYNEGYREIKVYEVASYVEQKVPKIVQNIFNRMQTPYSSLIGNNFTIGRASFSLQ